MSKKNVKPLKKIASDPVGDAIKRAQDALESTQNSDKGWGKFKGDKSDLWNTSFIVDYLLAAEEYGSIMDEKKKKKQIEFVENWCTNFFDTYNKIKEKEQSPQEIDKNPLISNNYTLAHSLSVLVKAGANKGLIEKIVDYLKSVQNEDHGWGWNKFSSSNAYGTTIVVNALMDARDIIQKIKGEKKVKDDIKGEKTVEEVICGGITWILKDHNRDGGWGVERGSDPKRTALALLTITRFLKKYNKLKEGIKEDCKLDIDYVKEKAEKGRKWLCSQWPAQKESKIFKIQSKIPGKGWRVRDSRDIDKVGFESTAYALWALIESITCGELPSQERKSVEQNIVDGLLWMLSSQEKNGRWHAYELKSDKMDGECFNFYPALGILVLSLYKDTIGKLESKEYITERFVENNLILLARLSYFKDSKLMKTPKTPRIFIKYPLSIVFSYQAAFISLVLLLLLPLLFHLRAVDITLKNIVVSLSVIGGVIIIPFGIIVIINGGYMAKIRTKIYDFFSRKLSAIERWWNSHKKEKFEIRNNTIKKAWEALNSTQNSDKGWGKFKGDKSDLWNTSFIVDCLLTAYTYSDIKKEIKISVDLVVKCCKELFKKIDERKSVEYVGHCKMLEKSSNDSTNDFTARLDVVKTENTNEKPVQESDVGISSAINYALAHSLSVLVKADAEKYKEIIEKIVNYLKSVQNEDHGWGWDKFSSSNVYGTAIIVNALMDARDIISKIKGEETVEDAICGGITWILKDHNRDGGWGVERGSDPKHTALALLTITRFLKEYDNLKEDIKGDCKLDINYVNEKAEDGQKWLYSEWPAKKQSKLFGISSKIPEKGWRAEDSRYPHRVGFESTAYAMWALIESKNPLQSTESKESTEKIRANIDEGCKWLCSHQEWDGRWHAYESENKMDGELFNFYPALGICVLSLYKKSFEKEIEEENLNVLMKENLVLKARLSTFRYPGIVALSKKLFIVLSWMALFFAIVLVLAVGYLGWDYLISICIKIYEFTDEDPIYLAVGGMIGLIIACHNRVVWFLRKLKESMIYGRKH